MSPNTGGPRFRPYASVKHHVTKGRYITSNDPRGYIPVYEYPLNGQWIMMDIDDGYILWTGIWKALGNSKADIVKMIDSQPDLAQVIRRVRGGYLKIQGTWMPYEVALRLSRRVAFPIREDLVPLFGPTFPSTCLSPDQPGYGQIVNSGHGRRRSRRPATAPNPSPTASMILQDPLRGDPGHPSWAASSPNIPQKGPHLGSPHMTHESQQPSLHTYHRGPLPHHPNQTVSDRSPRTVNLVSPTPSRDRGERLPPSSVRYSPYNPHGNYAKLDRRSLGPLPKLITANSSVTGTEGSASGNSPLSVDLPSLTIQELPSRPSLHLQVPSHRPGGPPLPPAENPLSAPARMNGSALSRTRSLGRVDKITLPPIRSPRTPLSASAVSGSIPSLTNGDKHSTPYALPPISALEDLRGVNAQDSAAVLRRLTADDDAPTYGPAVSSRSVPITMLQPPMPLAHRQNSSPSEPISDYEYCRHQQYNSDAELSYLRHEAPLSPSATSPISPSTPQSAFRDASRSSSHAILVREPSDALHVSRSPRHRVSGMRSNKDIEDEVAAGDVDMVFVGDEKSVHVVRSPIPKSEDDSGRSAAQIRQGAVPGVGSGNVGASRPPHRPW
jgi:hypothetical protein